MHHIHLSNFLPPSFYPSLNLQIAPIIVSADSTHTKEAAGAAPAAKEDAAAITVTSLAVVPSPTSPVAVTLGTGTGTAALTRAPSAILTLPGKDQSALSQTSEPYPITAPMQFGSVVAVLPLLPSLEAVTSPSSSSSSIATDMTHSLFNKKRISVSNITGTAMASSHLSDVAQGDRDRWLGLPAQAGPDPTTLSASVVLEQSERLLKKLLKVLHVCARYQMCTGKTLPPTIDYFGQTLLGMTSIR